MKNHRTDLKSIARRAMIERGLLPDFSAAAMAELARVQTAATDGHSDMRDLTGLLWASIDNDDSRDLDQLTVSEPHPDRSVTILVAIADVDALVKKESALDAHAQHNTTSVYTAGDIFPMLPEKLSTDLTSLGEGQDRLAIVVGIFGERGWGELQVITNDGDMQTLPVTKDTDEKIRYARKVLAEFGRKPITT